MYKIRGTDQKEYGPVSTETIRQWIAEGRVTAATPIQAEGSASWKPAAEFPEFKVAFPAVALPPVAQGPMLAPGSGLPTPARTSGLAITSLVLGILGFCSAGITSLIGLILGIIALNKIGKSQGALTGKGLAIAGICVSGVLLLLMPAIAIPNFLAARAAAQAGLCALNLETIGGAARVYAKAHQDVLPKDFLSMSGELNTPSVLVCPADPKRTKVFAWSKFTPESASYEIVSPGTADGQSAGRQVFVRCPIHGHVCYTDGRVERGRLRNPKASFRSQAPPAN